MHEALDVAAREAAGREASPTTAIIETRTAKAAQKGALDWTRRARQLTEIIDQTSRCGKWTLAETQSRPTLLQ